MNICASGFLTTQACTKSGQISLHKERMAENTHPSEQLRLLSDKCLSMSSFIQGVFLKHQGMDCSSLSSSVKTWLPKMAMKWVLVPIIVTVMGAK